MQWNFDLGCSPTN